ncbi:ATP-dependent helicase HrpB [Pseudoclavibacter endophyticus]|uniref:DEAD/DEAH box helicase n=1 Tax=Pseudoclavibacter endophyticus TaxID=1778590 RepID=A0A6H9WN64_9MICO|nr:ATP-dependent helicase C-terminal domain-containing protein [Pseudoclavibacter endophyticus]KAB1648198.1 DEAD/DEAH box helicase [Pseudoclavibacter endophyticus]GGA70565.1 ATP-dependent helicase HrpB [Pseudoclavibacter endophyticus]
MTRAPATFDLDAIGAGLPFAEVVSRLGAALRDRGAAAVVQAPPGSGKTTLVPPLVANALAGSRERQGRVVVTQPRRIAARAAARRLAHLDGSRLGDRVGFSIGGERVASETTVVEFVTPGVLVRRLLSDPELAEVGAVVLDEVHERSLETDLLVGMLAEVRQLRDDLALVAMSATLDAGRFAALLGGRDRDQAREETDAPGAEGASAAATSREVAGVPVIESPAVSHPLDIRWTPSAAPRLDDRGVTRAFLDHVAATAASAHEELLAGAPEADALVFLPGGREVAHVADRLRELAPGADVLRLEGRAPAREQDAAVSGRAAGGRPRIVVSTALAESSLTVPGVRLVVDAGLARVPKRDAARGMTGLVTVSASRASCDQRAGRAARLGPGRVVRCYDERAYAAAPAHPAPEIASADLVEAALVLACWGAPGGKGLALPDPPPRAALADAIEELRAIGAVDARGRATAAGHRLAAVPTDPRLARALLDAAPECGARAAAEAVALASGEVRLAGGDLDRAFADLGRGTLRLDDRVRALVERLERHAARASGAAGVDAGVEAARRAPGLVAALAFPGRIARLADAAAGTYLLASGTRAALPAGSALRGESWLAVAEVTRAEGRAAAGTGAVIRSAARLSEAAAERAASHVATDRVEVDFVDGRVVARRERRLGAIVRSSTPVAVGGAGGAGGAGSMGAARTDAHEAVARALARDGLGVLAWSDSAAALRRRLALLHRELGAPWPDVADAALLSRLDEWLASEIDALAGGTRASRIELLEPLRRLLPWPEAARLDALVPERLVVPSGSRVRIDYPAPGDDARPVIAVKLQECFGWAETPSLVDGRVHVVFHLLSPAGRPLAVTDDLASFWSGPYAQVRAEMRGRYPRHPWPEDPWAAAPTARTKGRR